MTCYFNDIPRDLQLHVLSKLDMDGRIKCGIIGKLNVPETLTDAISKAIFKKKKELYTLASFSKTYVDFSTLSHGDHVQLHPDLHELYGTHVEIVDGPHHLNVYTVRFLNIPANWVRYLYLYKIQYKPYDPDAPWYDASHL
jgi:hypothetical protein